MREPLAEGGVEVEPRRRPPVHRAGDGPVLVVGAHVADAAETVGGAVHVRLQHRAGEVAQRQVDPADDARAHPLRPELAAGRQRADAVGELGLAQRLEALGPAVAIEGPAVHEHRRPHVVARVHVGEHLVEHVVGHHLQHLVEPVHGRLLVRGAAAPQVVVGIDDRQIGLEDLLARGVGHGHSLLGPPGPRWVRRPWYFGDMEGRLEGAGQGISLPAGRKRREMLRCKERALDNGPDLQKSENKSAASKFDMTGRGRTPPLRARPGASVGDRPPSRRPSPGPAVPQGASA